MSPQPRTVYLSTSLYPLAAIEQATQAFADLCEFKRKSAGSDLVLTIQAREEAPADTADEFLSYALSAALEMHLSECS